MNFKNYSEKHIHFLDKEIPPLLKYTFRFINNNFSVVDIGCGDGRILYSLAENGFLKNAKEVIGVDLSKERCKEFRKNVESFIYTEIMESLD